MSPQVTIQPSEFLLNIITLKYGDSNQFTNMITHDNSSYQNIIKDIGDFPLDQTIVELIKENLDLDEVHIAYKPWDNGHWIRFIKGNKKIDGWISDNLLLEQEFDIINHELKRMEAALNV